jgi:hypothetical protein
MSVVLAPSADAIPLSEVDQLFTALDGMVVSNGVGEWSSRIHGIYADGPYVWVQVSRDDQDVESVILRVSRPTTAADIIRALEAVRFDTESPVVVRV